MTRLHVHGGDGRLGRAIVLMAKASGAYEVSISGREQKAAEQEAAWDIAIDVSQPQGSLAIAARCAAAGVPLVIGTTGHTVDELDQLRADTARTAILLSPNFSVGVNLLFWLTGKASEILGPEYDAEIVELHHRLKKDSPSGTANRLGEIIAETRSLQFDKAGRHGRKGFSGERTRNEIGVHALRGGDIVGEHTVYFAGSGERIELTHRASSRDTFAKGALRAADWLLGKPAGWYEMRDVLGLA
ncbi:MAG: 4-hydroxy-tetrahydrodipicolinate reductase [Verrucomicrobia bacterium]|nr:4-hydroxy-tetrahydrodipicolinate reductase [Verrucomicrobiota bacterium]